MWQLHLEAFSVKPHVVKGACNWKKKDHPQALQTK